jgi:hypothetical protein
VKYFLNQAGDLYSVRAATATHFTCSLLTGFSCKTNRRKDQDSTPPMNVDMFGKQCVKGLGISRDGHNVWTSCSRRLIDQHDWNTHLRSSKF